MDGILGEDEAQESQREEGAKGSLGLPLLREIQVGNGVKGSAIHSSENSCQQKGPRSKCGRSV
jgi:hypothetical protein